MRVADLIDELKRFGPHDEVGIELAPENFVTMDEEPICLAIEKVEPGNVAFDGCRAKIILGEIA